MAVRKAHLTGFLSSRMFAMKNFKVCLEGDDHLVFLDKDGKSISIKFYQTFSSEIDFYIKDSMITDNITVITDQPPTFNYHLTIEDLKAKKLPLVLDFKSRGLRKEFTIPLGYKEIAFYLEETNPVLVNEGITEEIIITVNLNNHFQK